MWNGRTRVVASAFCTNSVEAFASALALDIGGLTANHIAHVGGRPFRAGGRGLERNPVVGQELAGQFRVEATTPTTPPPMSVRGPPELPR